jgi:WD40 repeat protein
MLCCVVEDAAKLMIRFSADSRYVVVIVMVDCYVGRGPRWDNHSVRLYDVETGQHHSSFPTTSLPSASVTFSPDNESVVFRDDNTVQLWDYHTGLCHTKFKGCPRLGPCYAISPDATSMATVYRATVIKVQNLVATPENNTAYDDEDPPPIDKRDTVRAVAASHDGKLFATQTSYEIRVWDIRTGACNHVIENAGSAPDNPSVFEFSPNSRTLAYESQFGEVRLLDARTWSDCTFFDHTYRVRRAQFSRSGELLVSTSADGLIRLWHIVDGLCVSRLEGSHGEPTAVGLSRNNKLIAVGYVNGMIELWDVATGSSKTLAGHTQDITSIAFSQDARMLASGSNDKTTRLWVVETTSCRLVIKGYDHSTGQVAFSPDSKLLALLLSKHNGRILLWDTTNGQFRHVFENPPGMISNVSFSSCGTYLQSDRGCLPIPISVLGHPSIEIQRPPAIFVGRRWIYLNGTRILWLPLEYRPWAMRISGSTMLFENGEGKIIMLRLDLDELKRKEPHLFQSWKELEHYD